MVDQTDPDHPFVWKDVRGRLQKQEVTISEVREELEKVKISDGLTAEDSICIPDGTLKPGMKTAPMSEKPAETESVETMPEEGMESMPEEGVGAEPVGAAGGKG